MITGRICNGNNWYISTWWTHYCLGTQYGGIELVSQCFVTACLSIPRPPHSIPINICPWHEHIRFVYVYVCAVGRRNVFLYVTSSNILWVSFLTLYIDVLHNNTEYQYNTTNFLQILTRLPSVERYERLILYHILKCMFTCGIHVRSLFPLIRVIDVEVLISNIP